MSKIKFIKQCLIVVISGLLLFLLIHTLDNWFFFDDHFSGVHDLFKFYLEPVFALFEGVNLVIPIDDTKIYTDLMYPRWTNPVIYYLGIPWSIFLTWLCTKVTIVKGDRFLNTVAFILIVGLVTLLSAEITATIFGADFRRFCPGCP